MHSNLTLQMIALSHGIINFSFQYNKKKTFIKPSFHPHPPSWTFFLDFYFFHRKLSPFLKLLIKRLMGSIFHQAKKTKLSSQDGHPEMNFFFFGMLDFKPYNFCYL